MEAISYYPNYGSPPKHYYRIDSQSEFEFCSNQLSQLYRTNKDDLNRFKAKLVNLENQHRTKGMGQCRPIIEKHIEALKQLKLKKTKYRFALSRQRFGSSLG
ncbi:hypothetical protein D915_000426 [Fasciola hepatica]|uniref:Uncharacterized protein n=1 Tax=Fasciola hepatica TaxID=6192 RepID=A0A4E0RNZ0_FASHE|nr:hypothetical protein D915_000426 [Fasciola hepatica]